MPVDFSVVIPTYRRNRELAEAITSVLKQREVSLEIIIVDDCPEGSARDLVRRIQDDRIQYVKNPNPSGGRPSVVRNLGWPRTTGTFLHFLDDDDVVPVGHYATAKQAFEKYPNVGLIFGRIEPFGIGPESQLRHEHRYFEDAARKAASCVQFGTRWAYVGRMLFDQAILVCSAGIVRRECVVRVGGFDPDIRLMEDADFYTRVIRECGACFLDHVSIKYRIGSPSLMHSPNPTPQQVFEQRGGHRQMHTNYQATRGICEFYALALFTRVVLRIADSVSHR
jgi:glycosyltransferase involved in cell wall biosynthesis